MRSQDLYWKTIETLRAARTKNSRSNITKTTGISRLPLCAASVAFAHPTFFPLNPFHLFYENCMAFIWDTWTVLSKPGEVIHLSSEKAQKLTGGLIPLAMTTLPPAFSGPICDPYLKWWCTIPGYVVAMWCDVMLRNPSQMWYLIETMQFHI